MRFFTAQSEIEALTTARDRLYDTAADRQLYFHVGYFITCYAKVEIRLTYLLARAIKFSDMGSFELLTYGLDAKGKVDRFRKAADGRIGPNLERRLSIFYDVMRPLRNRVVHTFGVTAPDHSTIGFASLNQFPSFTETKLPNTKAAFEMPLIEFFECGAWLDLFHKDLQTVRKRLIATGIFEIDSQESPLPPEQTKDRSPATKAATLSKRQRRRQRKGQPPRGKE